jgi:hypothetical protein
VRDLIGRMLVKDREQRLGSLAEATAILAGGPAAAPPPQAALQPRLTGPAPAAAGGRPAADRSWIWALVAILVVGVGVALVIALT